MDQLKADHKRGRMLLFITMGFVVVFALLRLVAIFGPPIVLWTIANPAGQPLWGFPWVFEQYVAKVAETTGLSHAAVRLSFSFSTLLSCTLAVVGYLTARCREGARVLLLWLCSLLSAYHLVIGSQTALNRNPSGLLDDLSWSVLYLAVVLIVTRQSVLALFPGIPRSGPQADLAS